MNNTKVAVVWTDKRPPDFYYSPNWATKLAKHFPKNYSFAFFAYTDTNSAVYKEKDNITIWFKPDIKTLVYGVNVFFEPDILIVIGTSNFNFESLLGVAKKTIYIHKGLSHKPKDFGLFDYVIVETPEDVFNYKKSIIQPVCDTDNFENYGSDKYYSVCYPQDISEPKFDFFNKVRLYGSISNSLTTTVKLPLYKLDVLNLIFNQSKVVSLLEDFDSFELALSALSCNTPVVALESTKASRLPAVLKAKYDENDFLKQTLEAVSNCYNYRDEYILPNFSVGNMANVIKKLL
jgi:hypothetical protein